MFLQKTIQDVLFRSGVDKRTDAKLSVKLETLENCRFGDSDTISKRPGYVSLGTDTIGAALAGGHSLYTAGKELLRASTGLLHSKYGVSSKWIERGSLPMTTVRRQDIRQAATNIDHYSFAQASAGYYVAAWTEGTALYYCVRDKASNAIIVEPTQVESSDCRSALVITNRTTVSIVYVKGSSAPYTLKLRAVNATTFAVGSAVDLKTDVGALEDERVDAALFDAAVSADGNTVAVVYNENSGSVQVFTCTISGGSISANATTGNYADMALHVNFTSGGNIFVFQGFAAIDSIPANGGIEVHAFDSNLNLGNSQTIQTLSSEDEGIVNITSYGDGSGGLTCFFGYFATHSAFNDQCAIRQASVDSSGDSGSPSTLVRGVSLAGAAFNFAGATHLPCYFASRSDAGVSQASYFVVQASGAGAGRVTARALSWLAGGHGLNGALMLGRAMDDTSATVYLSARVVNGVNPGELLDQGKGFVRIALGDATTADRSFVETVAYTFFPGGCPYVYDGANLVEAGFHLYPEGASASQTTEVAGELGVGTFQWCFCFEWIDERGRLWRSAPSVPISLTTTSGNAATLSIPTLRLTEKEGARIAVFRTVNGGSSFFRVANVANDKSVDRVSYFDDVTSDATLQGNEPLYTGGGVLENDFVPACRFAVVHQTRVVLGGLESDDEVVFSQEDSLNGEGLQFPVDFRRRVEPGGGEVTGLASMDGRLIAAKADGFFALSGVGPNARGGQDGFSEFERLPADTGVKPGCSKSIVETPQGLMFLSPKGIRLLDRSLGLQPIGAEVDSLATACVAATVDRSKNLARFYTGSSVLVWDYLYQQWSVDTNHSAVDAVWWAGASGGYPVHADSSTGTHYGNSGTTDAGSNITMKIVTGWLKPGMLQGFQRIWWVYVLGTYRAATTLSLELGHNYEAAWAAAVTKALGSLTLLDGATAITDGAPFQLRHKPTTQRCEAIRFRITESGGAGASFSLTGLSLEMGVKRGAFKLPSARAF